MSYRKRVKTTRAKMKGPDTDQHQHPGTTQHQTERTYEQVLFVRMYRGIRQKHLVIHKLTTVCRQNVQQD